MKFIFKIFIILNVIVNLFTLNLRKDIVQVVNRHPSDLTMTSIKMSPHVSTVAYNSPSPFIEKRVNDLYNSNTSTAPDATPYTKKAEIVYPHMDFVTKSAFYAPTSANAIIGARQETATVTSIDKVTGQVNKNEFVKETPILGRVTGAEKLIKTDRATYDLKTGSFRAGPSSIEVPEK